MISTQKSSIIIYTRIIKRNPLLNQCFCRHMGVWFSFWKYGILSMRKSFGNVGAQDCWIAIAIHYLGSLLTKVSCQIYRKQVRFKNSPNKTSLNFLLHINILFIESKGLGTYLLIHHHMHMGLPYWMAGCIFLIQNL